MGYPPTRDGCCLSSDDQLSVSLLTSVKANSERCLAETVPPSVAIDHMRVGSSTGCRLLLLYHHGQRLNVSRHISV